MVCSIVSPPVEAFEPSLGVGQGPRCRTGQCEVAWRAKEHATAGRAHRGRAVNVRRSRQLRPGSRATAPRESSDQCRDNAPHPRCPHKRSCCYSLFALGGWLRESQSQGLVRYQLADQFSSWVCQRTVAAPDHNVSQKAAAASVYHRDCAPRRTGLEKLRDAEISGQQHFSLFSLLVPPRIPDPLRKIPCSVA